ncbi:hypothetical protein BS78_K161000 [Paspalum vaginatum]|uniref:Adenylyl-sulfate kinase n=1 Tax=Paspalum vaginatum TaxID=158149 RepID=A0A9W7XBA2_9POAL|nr:hypothetical protein BS78_K161000 [Paspalum vaginatum]
MLPAARAPPRPCSGGGVAGTPRGAQSTRPWGAAPARGGRQASSGVKLFTAARPIRTTAADGTHLAASGSAAAGSNTESMEQIKTIAPRGKEERQKLLNQKGCVVWITGLSGSGKSTLACALSRELHSRGHLTYVLDGDNLRHGLNRDLSFKAEDRAENIRRVGEAAKLFADAGLICIASLISPYRSDRSVCRSLLPESSFIEVFLDASLDVCEARDPKGLYKLARAGKIKGFTGIDDPYEPPTDCEIVIQCRAGDCPSPKSMADQVVSYLETHGFLQD